MKNKIFIFITLIGLIGLMSSCEKDGDKIELPANVIAPKLVTIPDLTLLRENSTDSLEFKGTPVDPGFVASATYFLEAAEPGTNFENSVVVFSDIQVSSMKMTVNDLNAKLLEVLPEDATSAVEFRIRCNLTVDAGTGAPGTGDDPFEYISDVVDDEATIFGLLRLDLIGSGIDQKIVSPNSDGYYFGIVDLNTANAFTLNDPETATDYGGTGGTLSVGGAAITPPANGDNLLSVDIVGMTYSVDPITMGVIGSATPDGWDSDQDMTYNPASKKWEITMDFTDGEFKFRRDNDWGWNLGLLTGSNSELVGSGANIPISAGNYTIKLKVTSYADQTGTFEAIKN